jgi:glutamate/tyrosine decarboxylase-like PLP-dependent enzyme
LYGIQAALILGMQWRALPVSKKDHYSLTGETVRKALEEDRAKGLVPFLLSESFVVHREMAECPKPPEHVVCPH